MIKVIPSAERHHQNFSWLDTRWHFSFDTYYDPENLHWGALRVFNDDVVQPAQGFGTHPHRDMEIITYVLDGELEHRDSAGHQGVVRPGEIQVMTAGTGIRHSEFNHSQTKPLHFLQIWVLPRAKGLEPRWDQRVFPAKASAGKLLPIVSGGEVPGTLGINQDAQVYVASLKVGQTATHRSLAGRKGYLFVIDGELALNGTKLLPGDQARLAEEVELRIKARKDSELILLDLPDAT